MNKIILINTLLLLLFLSFCKKEPEKSDLDNVPVEYHNVTNAKKIASFSEPGVLQSVKILGKHIYIADKKYMYSYNFDNFKFVAKLNEFGEGPSEFTFSPLIYKQYNDYTLVTLLKIVILDSEYKYVKDIKLGRYFFDVIPLGEYFIKSDFFFAGDNLKCIVYLFDKHNKVIRKIISFPKDTYQPKANYIFHNIAASRVWKKKLYIGQSYKGLYFDVFDENGNFLYKISRHLSKIKVEKKHLKNYFDYWKFFLGETKFNSLTWDPKKYKVQEYVPAFKDFQIQQDKIYVKTFDIKDDTEKYIIMDLKGNITKCIYLPITFWKSWLFHQNTFFYLRDNGNNECWDLYTIQL